jgi:carboxyl-terminal processing protease
MVKGVKVRAHRLGKVGIGVAGFALGVGCTLALTLTWGPGPRAANALRLGRSGYDTVMDAVLARYVDPVDESELTAAALRGVLQQLDPHSHFLTADERKALRRRASGGASGLSIALVEDGGGSRRLEVLAVAPDSPAAKKGVRPGDHVVRLRGREAERIESQVQVELLLAGAVGEDLALHVQSPDEASPRHVELVLDKPKSKTVESAIVDLGGGRKIVHLVVRRFGSETGVAVKKAIESRSRVAGDALVGIVLDLRGNPGGEVDEALVVADLFVADGVLTRTRGRGGKLLREELAHKAGTDTTTPLVVLQDRRSASASELLAVALQEHGRAKIVGERSYGKGTVQEVLGLADGSVAAFTVARYYSPKDNLVDGVGVGPDVHVVLQPTVPKAGLRDEGLEAAISQF